MSSSSRLRNPLPRPLASSILREYLDRRRRSSRWPATSLRLDPFVARAPEALTEPEVSEDDQDDDDDPDDVEHVHAHPPLSFLDASRRGPTRLVDLGPTGPGSAAVVARRLRLPSA